MSEQEREPSGVDGLHTRLARIEEMLAPQPLAKRAVPAWQRVTQGEQRWAMASALCVAVALQLLLPDRLSFRPAWLLPALELALLAMLFVVHPGARFDRASRLLRTGGLTLVAAASLANGWSAWKLVEGIVSGHEGGKAAPLLFNGAGVWLTNIIVFALWYWELDRGGPVARARAVKRYPDFLFPQMQQPEIAPPGWEPQFMDYLYVAFTNATAFSPTDTMPLSRWAKMLMFLQSLISLLTVVLVVARAVNILT
jgi:hypothetical protein